MWLVGTAIAVVLAGIGLVYLSVILTNRPEELWLEAGKAGMQLLVLGVLGGLLTAGWQRAAERRGEERAKQANKQQRDHEEAERERQRDLEEHERRLQQQRELHERQLAMFLQVVSAYNGLKAVRRRLKSLGFRQSNTARQIDAWQAAGFHEAMARLSEHQLVFEALARELRETQLFADDSNSIAADLDAIEKYVKTVVDFWERHGAEIQSGAPVDRVARGVRTIVSYSAFESGVVVYRQQLTESMHNHLFVLAAGSGPSA